MNAQRRAHPVAGAVVVIQPRLPQGRAGDGVDVAPRLKVLKTVEPAGRSAGVKVANAAELVSKLKTAGVI